MRIESNLRRTPLSDSGPRHTFITAPTTTGTAKSAPIVNNVVAVVFCVGRCNFPAINKPIPHPTAVCVTVSNPVFKFSVER